MIVHSSDPVTIVGGADIQPDDLSIALAVAPTLVAADGGADHLLAAGLVPNAVIGDFDSISDAARVAFQDQLHRVDEQHTTDFEKALVRVDAPLCLCVGFSGGRLDHAIAVLNAVARHKTGNTVLLGSDDAVFLVSDRTVKVHVPQRTAFSILPLDTARVTSEGLRWELSQTHLSLTGLVSSSNQTTADLVSLDVAGTVAVTLPRAQLAAALVAALVE